MITLIVGKKGSGKTKRLIDAANAATQNVSGNVVVIEPKDKLRLEISHGARLIDLEPYEIHDAAQLYGFIAGILAGNYDVQEIYVDSVLRVISEAGFETFIEKIRTLAEYAEINITFSVSLDEDELPEGIRESCTIDTSIAK